MITALLAMRQRVLAVLGAISMYRLALFALAALAVIALGLSLARLVGPTAPEILATFAVLAVAISAVEGAADFEPLPPGFPEPYLEITGGFYFNASPAGR